MPLNNILYSFIHLLNDSGFFNGNGCSCWGFLLSSFFFLFFWDLPLVIWRLHLQIFILGKLYLAPSKLHPNCNIPPNFLLLKLAFYTKIWMPFRVLTNVFLRPGDVGIGSGLGAVALGSSRLLGPKLNPFLHALISTKSLLIFVLARRCCVSLKAFGFLINGTWLFF